MKKLLALSALLFTVSAYADLSEFHDLDLFEVLQFESVSTLYEGKANISELEFLTIEPLDELEYSRCKDAMYETVFLDMDGDEYRAVYSNDDYCDGGATFGYIQDQNTSDIVGKVIADTIELN